MVPPPKEKKEPVVKDYLAEQRRKKGSSRGSMDSYSAYNGARHRSIQPQDKHKHYSRQSSTVEKAADGLNYEADTEK